MRDLPKLRGKIARMSELPRRVSVLSCVLRFGVWTLRTLSLLTLLAVAVFWIRSYSGSDCIELTRDGDESGPELARTYSITTSRGRLAVCCSISERLRVTSIRPATLNVREPRQWQFRGYRLTPPWKWVSSREKGFLGFGYEHGPSELEGLGSNEFITNTRFVIPCWCLTVLLAGAPGMWLWRRLRRKA